MQKKRKERNPLNIKRKKFFSKQQNIKEKSENESKFKFKN